MISTPNSNSSVDIIPTPTPNNTSINSNTSNTSNSSWPQLPDGKDKRQQLLPLHLARHR